MDLAIRYTDGFGFEYGLADIIAKNKYYTKEALQALQQARVKEKEKEGDLANYKKTRYMPDIRIPILYDELENLFKCGYHRSNLSFNEKCDILVKWDDLNFREQFLGAVFNYVASDWLACRVIPTVC